MASEVPRLCNSALSNRRDPLARHLLEVGLGRPAVGAYPTLRQILKRRPRWYPSVGVALGWVVDVAADSTVPAFHEIASYCH